MSEQYYVVDTNTLLDDITVIDKYKVVITSDIIRELEKHKSQKHDKLLAYNARQAVRAIRANSDVIKIDLKDYQWDINNAFDSDYVDNKIIQCCVENEYGLITNDILLQFKAEMYNIPLIILDDSNQSDTSYKGYKKVFLEDEELANFYENLGVNTFNLLNNEYILIKNIEGEDVDVYRWDGETHKPLKLPNKKVVAPKNVLQECAIDLLHNRDIPIKIIAGTYGSGKTFLNVKIALHHVLDKGYQSKIMVVRNPLGSGEEIGFLKGTKDDKTVDFFKPFVQHLEGGEQESFYLEQSGKLIKEIPYYIKGLSIEDTFVIVDEAEDLNRKMLKLIGTRIAKNSVICFSGDFNQAEDKFSKDNGLRQAIESLKGNPLVGIIVLDEDVRSEASKVFADM